MKIMRFLLIILIIFMIASCSKNNKYSEENTVKNQNNEETSNIDDTPDISAKSDIYSHKKPVVWLTNNFISLSDEVLDMFNIRIDNMGYDFYLDVVRLNPVEYKEKLNEYLSSGEQVDLISCFLNSGNSYSIDYSTKFALNNNLVILNDYLFSEEGNALYSSIDENVWKSLSCNGKIYSVPGTNPYVYSAYYYNEQYTPNDYVFNEESFISLCENTNYSFDDAFLLPQVSDLISFNSYLELDNICSAVFADCKNSNIDSLFNQSSFIDFITMLNNFYKEGLISENSSLIYNNTSNYNDNIEGENYIVALATGLENKAMKKVLNYIYSDFQGTVGISSKSNNIDDAFKLLTLVHTDSELANLLVYGIKDVDYKVVDNAVEGKNATFNEFSFGLYDNVYPPSNDKDRVAKKKAQINEALPSPYLGFYFDSTGYEEIMKNVYDITYNNLNVWKDNDFENKIISIQKELEEAGINQLVEEVKRQAEEWKNIITK